MPHVLHSITTVKTVFPSYETAINEYLRKFGGRFQAGESCLVDLARRISLHIQRHDRQLTPLLIGGTVTPGVPSFQ